MAMFDLNALQQQRDEDAGMLPETLSIIKPWKLLVIHIIQEIRQAALEMPGLGCFKQQR